MRKWFALFLSVLVVCALHAELVVYTYDSMVSGLGKIVSMMFEERYGVKVKMVSFGDAGSMLTRLIIEGKHTKADVILGLDQNLLIKAKKSDVLIKYKPKYINKINREFIDSDFYAVPFDYGAVAVVYNKDKVKVPPTSFEDLLRPEFKRRIVVEDPRTSSTGLAFLLWTIGVYGEDFTKYWKKLNDNLLTITASWDYAYSMLENGEADLIVSYITDAAYSHYYYKSAKYLPAVFKEGMYVQVEYVGICKFTDDLDLAKKFVDFMLSEEVQGLIPLNQWMLPVVDVKLPEVFVRYVPKFERIVKLDPKSVEKNLERWISEWEEVVGVY